MRSLRLRLILFFLVIEAVVILGLAIFAYHAASRAMLDALDGQIRSRLLAMASTIEEEEDGAVEFELSGAWFLDFGPGSSAFFHISRADGTPLISSPSLGERRIQVGPEWLRPEGTSQIDLQLVELEGQEVRLGRLLISTRAPQGHGIVPFNPRDAFLIVTGIETRDMRLSQGTLLARLAAMGASALLLSIVGGYLLATLGLRPIRRLAREVDMITEERLDLRLPERGLPRELRPLSRGFNAALRRLAAAFERERQFTADASHELRTPVTVARSATEIALRRERTGEEYREALEAAHEANLRMQSMVERMMALAEADHRSIAAKRKSVDLAALVEDVIAYLRPLADRHEVEVTWIRPPSPAVIQGDADSLREMVANLVSNAVIHNHRGGWVRVGVEADRDAVALRVEDGGPGIAPEHIPHLFERFYRVDKARSREHGGSGLGLAIAQSIAQAHGGITSVVSHVGEGSVFTARLPVPGQQSMSDSRA